MAKKQEQSPTITEMATDTEDLKRFGQGEDLSSDKLFHSDEKIPGYTPPWNKPKK